MTAAPDDDIDIILVDRLAEHWDCWAILGLRPEQVRASSLEASPIFIPVEARDQDYHIRRIRHFACGFATQEACDPIDIDNECCGGHITPHPIVTDGHHRICGALLAGRATLPARYSGRRDTLDYLQGLRDDLPGSYL